MSLYIDINNPDTNKLNPHNLESINRQPENVSALIAMSGGVDSSVAAYLMVEEGFDCIGVTMKLFQNDTVGVERSRTCCSLEDVEDARSVSARLGIPYYVFNFTADFKEQVIDRFISAYENGATPNPCIACNRYLKFDSLYHRAAELGCEYVVTGHYARIEERDGRCLLLKAVDPAKDQSYVLYSLTQDQLRHTRFPLGHMTKTEARKVADAQDFINSKKPDSQDICFVPDGDYAAFITGTTGKVYPSGDFVSEDGTVLGRHNGIINYTIGQRHGLGITADRPLYVKHLNLEDNTVVVAEDKALYTRAFKANDFNWIAYDTPPRSLRAKAKIRYRHKEQPAAVTVNEDRTVSIVFDEPQRAITKGQAVVLYDGDVVLGGGTICDTRTEPST